MAYFIKINECFFKVPNRLIVGRGEPFTTLNDDRSVARSHLLLLQKNKKFYVKDLGTDSGSMINGSKIKSRKLIEVKPDIPVKIGDSELVILSVQPTCEFVEIKGNSLKVNTSDFNYSYIITALFAVFTLMNVYDLWKEGKTLGFLIFMFFAQLAFIGLMVFLISKWLNFIKSMSANLVMKDAFFSDEGFTVHYKDGGNMTFKTDKIEAWSLGNHLIEVKIYGEKYILAPTKEQLRTIEVYFNKHLRSKKTIVVQSPASAYAILLCLGLVMVSLGFHVMFQLGVTAAGLLIMTSIAMLAKPELRKHWVIPANRNFTPEKQLKSIIFMGLFSLYSAHLMIDHKDLVAKIEACSGRTPSTCKELDFDEVYQNDLKVNQETLVYACEQGNQSACGLKTNRSVASEK